MAVPDPSVVLVLVCVGAVAYAALHDRFLRARDSDRTPVRRNPADASSDWAVPVLLGCVADTSQPMSSRLQSADGAWALDADATLDALLDSRDRVLRVHAARRMAEHWRPSFAPRLVRLLRSGSVVDAARLDEGVQALLVSLAPRLAHTLPEGAAEAAAELLYVPDADVQRAGADALAVVGTLDQIAPLRALLASVSMMRPALKGSVELAIAKIQSRSGAQAGAVSLAEGSDGAGLLAVVDREAAKPDGSPPRQKRVEQ